MTKPINTAAIEKTTGKAWSVWTKELDEHGARELSHAALAKLVNTKLDGIENAGWWAQGITVAYEQHIGKRIPGQLADGLFEIAVSKTSNLPRHEQFARVVAWFEMQREFSGQQPLKPRSSETPKRSNWRCDFEDGSKFAATVEENGEKSKVVLSQTAIPSKEAADEQKVYWKTVLGEIIQEKERV